MSSLPRNVTSAGYRSSAKKLDTTASSYPTKTVLLQHLEGLHGFEGNARVHERRLEQLAAGQPASFDLEELLPRSVPGGYKDRTVDAALLHYALWRDWYDTTLPSAPAREVSFTETVLRAKADPNGCLVNIAFNHKQEIPSVVYAASLGAPAGLRSLLERQVDVNAPCVMDGKPHFAAMHDAVFMERPQAVQLLLEARACINVKNKDGLTPLHLAAWGGAADIVEDLVNCDQFHPDDLKTRARVRRETEVVEHLSPIELATFQTWYPAEKLTLLMPFTYGRGSFFEVVRAMVRQDKHSSLSRLLDGIDKAADSDDSEGIKLKHRIKFEALCRRGRYSRCACKRDYTMVGLMAEVIERAPEVAAQLLDLLTGRPYVKRTNAMRHPLPVTADLTTKDFIGRLLGHHDPLLSAYQGDYMDQDLMYWTMLSSYSKQSRYRPLGLPEWKFDTRNNVVPDWHKRFMATPGAKGVKAIQTLVVMLPGMLDLRIVHALNRAPLTLWASPAVQCLGYHMWSSIVHRAFYWRVFRALLLATTLSVRAMLRDGDVRVPLEERHDGLRSRGWVICLVVICATGIRELLSLAYRLRQHLRYGFKARHFWSIKSDVCPKVPEIVVQLLLAIMILVYAFFAVKESCREHYVNIGGGGSAHGQHALEHALDLADPDEEPHRAFQGSLTMLFLIVNVGLRWFHVLFLLRGSAGVGEKFLAITASFDPMGEIFTIVAFGTVAFVTMTCAMRGPVPVKRVVWWVIFGIFCGDGDALSHIMSLDKTLFKGWVSLFLVSVLLFFMTLTLLNLIIGVFGNAYTAIEEQRRLLFLAARNRLCEQFLLEPTWPRVFPEAEEPPAAKKAAGGDDSDLDEPLVSDPGRARRRCCRCFSDRAAVTLHRRRWYLVAGVYFVVAAALLAAPMSPALVATLCVALALAEILLQAVLMYNDEMDDDIWANGLEGGKEVGDDSIGSSDEEDSDADLVGAMTNTSDDDDESDDGWNVPARCLWMAVRSDFDKDFYEHDTKEMRDYIVDLQDQLQGVNEKLESLTSMVEALASKS